MVLFAATKGFLDEIPVRKIAEYERELISFFENDKKMVEVEYIRNKLLNVEARTEATFVDLTKQIKDKVGEMDEFDRHV